MANKKTSKAKTPVTSKMLANPAADDLATKINLIERMVNEYAYCTQIELMGALLSHDPFSHNIKAHILSALADKGAIAAIKNIPYVRSGNTSLPEEILKLDSDDPRFFLASCPLLCLFWGIRSTFHELEPLLRDYGGWHEGVPFAGVENKGGALHMAVEERSTPTDVVTLVNDAAWLSVANDINNRIQDEMSRFKIALDSVRREYANSEQDRVIGQGTNDNQYPRTVPMSLAELARRLTGRQGVRGSKFKVRLEALGLVSETERTFTIRLDLCDPATRKRMEAPF